MPRLAPTLTVLLIASVAGCLTPPPLSPRRDGGARDARTDTSMAALSVLSVTVNDARGEAWPANAAPRLPTIRIVFSDDVASSVGTFLLEGPSDPDLIDDLAGAPLRDATFARALPVHALVDGDTVILTPEAPLAPGSSATVAVVAWFMDVSGSRLGLPFTSDLVISSAPEAGARATDAWPPDGAFAVPTVLSIAALRFDGDLEDVAHAIVLRDASDADVDGTSERVACVEIGWPSGTCATFRPAAPLSPGTAYAIATRPDTRDATGAPVPSSTFRFVTGDGSEPAPLRAIPPSCADDELGLDDACARVDDESIRLRLSLSGAARIAWQAASFAGSSVAPRGDVVIALEELGPSTPLSLEVFATDYSGIETAFAFLVSTLAPLPTLSITEVRSDPAGAEPRQEYVELLNYGTVSVDLTGLFLSDSASDGDPLPSIEVGPGARVLLVTDDFDPDEDASGRDAAVPAATMLLRIDHTLCAGGLSNAGEPVFLRDTLHQRISSAPASPPPREGVCIVRTSSSMRSGEPGTFEYDPLGTCTPGR